MRKEEKNKLKNKNMKKQRGITLIALVITIIVLLILAGVTLNLVIGENGIIRTAEQAGKNYMNAQDKELAELEKFANSLNNMLGGGRKRRDTSR